jgi:hypothetical protein
MFGIGGRTIVIRNCFQIASVVLLLSGVASVRAESDAFGDIGAKVRELVPKLDHDDFRVRHRAALLLKNLPGDAWPAVREALEAKGLSAESRRALESVGHVLRARQLNATRYNDLTWNRESAVAAYDAAGRHDVRWDEAARTALRLFPRPSFDAQVHPKDDAARLQAFETAAGAGCDDPLFLYCYARILEERPEEERDKLKVQQLYAAAEKGIAKSNYPAIRKCFVLVRYANSLAAGEGDASFKKVLELLPAAAREPGVRASHILALAWTCMDALGQGSDRKAAYEAVQAALDAALPGKVEPLLLKGESLKRLAQQPPSDQKFEPLAAPLPFHVAASSGGPFAQAVEALKAANDLDPTDYRAATAMLSLLVHPGGRPAFNADDASGGLSEEIDRWYRRAMDANPDNYEACLLMLEYHQSDWRSGDGGVQAVLRFGRSCAAGGNYYGRIPFILAEAHLVAAQSTGNRDLYLRDPAVWREIHDLYETHLALFPDQDYYRSGYAKWAVDCSRWEEAKRLFEGLTKGEAPDMRPFGSEEVFQLYQQRAAEGWARAKRNQPGP